jgi:hypothetical protein
MRNRIQLLNRSLRGLWFVLFFAIACPASAATTFTASLDRTSVILGEQVTLSLKFEGGKPESIANFPLDGAQMVSGVSQNTSIVSTSAGQTYVYTCSVVIEPTRAGDVVIPAITAKVDGKTMTSQPITMKVAASDVFAPPDDYASRMAFLWVIVPRTNLFINEPVVAEFRIYLRSDVHRYDNVQLSPDGTGVAFSKLAEGQQYTRRVGNASFTVLTLSAAITPVKTGTVSINPVNGSILLNARDPMDMFFGSRLQPQQASLTSAQIDLHVAPLPTEKVPAGFNGAVGSYTMAVSVGPTNLVAGDPITLRVQISGRGALDTIALPEQKGWDNFKTYPATSKINATDNFGIQGSKTFEQIVTPQNSDIHTLPPISFSFFDPEKKEYRTLNHPATPLVVRAATPGAMPTAPTAHAENSQPTADVVPLKQHLGELAQIRPPLLQQSWFWGLQGLPILALVSSVIWRKRKENLANNPRLRRQRQVAQLVREGLQQLQQLAGQNKSDEFFATLFRLLQEQLGERLDLPASAITEAVIDERLRPRGLTVETLTSLHELFQKCNLARYAPVKSSQELAAIIPKLETTLNELREVEV